MTITPAREARQRRFLRMDRQAALREAFAQHRKDSFGVTLIRKLWLVVGRRDQKEFQGWWRLNHGIVDDACA